MRRVCWVCIIIFPLPRLFLNNICHYYQRDDGDDDYDDHENDRHDDELTPSLYHEYSLYLY